MRDSERQVMLEVLPVGDREYGAGARERIPGRGNGKVKDLEGGICLQT